MPYPAQPKWVIEEAIALHSTGTPMATIAQILASKGVKSAVSGLACTPTMVNNWIVKANSTKPRGYTPKKKTSPADVAVTLAPKGPEDGDLALLRSILDSASYDKPKKLKMFKNLIAAMDA